MAFHLAAFADEAAGSLAGQIAAMKENGVSLLEIRGVDGVNIADLTCEAAHAIRAKLDDAGIKVWALGSPYGKVDISEPFDRELDRFKHGLELAGALGAKRIRLFSFRGAPALDEVLERLGRFLEEAKDSGVTLCHENEAGTYGDTADRCLALCRALPTLRAVFDPANFIQCGQDVADAWRKLSPYVAYLHVKDALADGTVVPAGKGVGSLPWLIGQYKGEVLTVEPHLAVGSCYASAREAFDAAVSAVKEIIRG